ncbi:putative permease family protein [Escherichia coli 3-373-03_S3_C1]|jgi:hypothetical protein|nr:putative permease family protein [Escherichia coli 3-373-03_S3_C1]
MTGQSSSQAATPIQWWKPALFFLVVIAGLWYVKWEPYYGKAFTAAETHSIGKSILAQADANPWQAALDYAMIYFLAVWKAAVLGVILGSLIQVLIPRDWLLRTLGQSRFRGTLLGTLFSLPGMMCTCCAAPVAAASPTGVDGRCAGILDGQSGVKPGDAGVYGLCPRLGFCGDSSGGRAGDGVADCDAGAKMGA